MESEFTAPAEGLLAWSSPDPTTAPAARIEARVEMRLLERRGDWGFVECSNGWRGWVDARGLLPVRQTSPWNPALATIGGYTITLADIVPPIVIVLGALLPWVRGDLKRSSSFDIPLPFLTHPITGQSAIKVGMLLVIAALLALVVPSPGLRSIAYAIALAAAVLYVIQLNRLLQQSTAGVSVWRVLGAGIYVECAAAVIGLGVTLVPRR